MADILAKPKIRGPTPPFFSDLSFGGCHHSTTLLSLILFFARRLISVHLRTPVICFGR